MPSTIAEEKKALRAQVRRELAALSPQELCRGDEALFARFLALPQVERAKTIFAFWGIPGREPDTAKLIRELTARGKVVGLPRMLPQHQMEVRRYDPDRPMVKVSFGIMEPDQGCPILAREEIDLVLVPAVCYPRCATTAGATAWASGAATTTGGWRASQASGWACAARRC